MFMAFMSLLIICSALLLGGKLGLLASVRIRYTGLIVLALGVQILITEVITTAPRALDVALHLGSYAAAGVALWANRALPGLVLIGVGAMLNAAIITLNGGTMPASAHALANAGLSTRNTGFVNSGIVHHPVLPWLGDILATPQWLPFRNVLSVGDIIILVGAVVLGHWVSRSRLSQLFAWFGSRSLKAGDRLSA